MKDTNPALEEGTLGSPAGGTLHPHSDSGAEITDQYEPRGSGGHGRQE